MRIQTSKIFIGVSSLIFFGFIAANVVNNQTDTGAEILLVPKENRFITVNKEISVAVMVNAKQPVNAVSATIRFPSDSLEVVSVSKENSIIKFWIEEAQISGNTIKFSGIVTGGFEGEQKALTIVFKSKKPKEITLDFIEASVLANDGKGTEVLNKKSGVVLVVREAEIPSPDLNNDGSVNFTDISILIFHWGKTEKPEYDLNRDGKINLPDLSILVSRYVGK